MSEPAADCGSRRKEKAGEVVKVFKIYNTIGVCIKTIFSVKSTDSNPSLKDQVLKCILVKNKNVLF